MLNFLSGYLMGERAATRAASMTREAGGAAGATAGEFHDVNERVDRLVLVVESLWSLLRDTGWTDEQLKARMDELDSADGVSDGRRTPLPRRCSECDSMVEPTRSNCAFCGVAVEGSGGITDGV